MKELLRKLRGLAGLGSLWAAIWAPATVAIATVERLVSGFGFPPVAVLIDAALTGLASGFTAGVLFGAGLSLVYRARAFRELRSGPLGVLGVAAGVCLAAAAFVPTMLLTGATPPAGAIGLVSAYIVVLGGASAMGTLKLAWRAKSLELESPDSSETRLEPGHATTALHG